MVSSGFRNRGQNDESIPAHLEYRIRLSALESEKMLFWNYYVNEQHPDKIVWNSGRHRYFDNVWMAQILRDIVSLRKDPVQRDLAQRFLEYFCQANQLDANTLPQPDGALSRI